MPGADLPLLTFADSAAFECWLDAHGTSAPGAWLRFAKQGAPEATISKSDAIDCALAYGWVDGQLGRVDDHFFKTRFTPRRPRSAWSQANRQRVEKLEQAGRMRPAGLAEVGLAKADGRWAAAYPGQGQAVADADLQTALDADPAARRLFDALDAANRYAVLYRVQQARTPEKRAAKIAELVAMLSRGETIPPLDHHVGAGKQDRRPKALRATFILATANAGQKPAGRSHRQSSSSRRAYGSLRPELTRKHTLVVS